MDEPYVLHQPEPKWKVEIKALQLVVTTPNHCNWWFRFWVSVFFGGKWTKL